jgi:hypothetical protein
VGEKVLMLEESTLWALHRARLLQVPRMVAYGRLQPTRGLSGSHLEQVTPTLTFMRKIDSERCCRAPEQCLDLQFVGKGAMAKTFREWHSLCSKPSFACGARQKRAV